MEDKRSKKAVSGNKTFEASGSRASANKQLKMEASIYSFIQKGISDYLGNLSGNQEAFEEWFEELPSSVQGSLINQFVPKAKNVDATLKASMLSLTKSFETLPNIDNLTKRLHALTTENGRLKIQSQRMETLNAILLEKCNEICYAINEEGLKIDRHNLVREFMDYFVKEYKILHEEYKSVIEQSKQMIMTEGEYIARLEGVFDVTEKLYQREREKIEKKKAASTLEQNYA